MKKKNSENEDNKVYSCKFTFADSKDRKLFMVKVIKDSIPDGIPFFVEAEDLEIEEFENSSNSEKENKMICNRDCDNYKQCEELSVEDELYNATLLALHNSSGNVAEAANLLGISKSQMYRRIKKYEILDEDWESFEDEEEVAVDDPETETRNALIQNNWNVKSTAEDLGVSDSTVYRRMKKFGIYR